MTKKTKRAASRKTALVDKHAGLTKADGRSGPRTPANRIKAQIVNLERIVSNLTTIQDIALLKDDVKSARKARTALKKIEGAVSDLRK